MSKSAKTTKVKHKKFTNEVRLQVLQQKGLEAQKKFLSEWFDNTTDPSIAKLRKTLLDAPTSSEFETIMFNMQLKSEGLGVL